MQTLYLLGTSVAFVSDQYKSSWVRDLITERERRGKKGKGWREEKGGKKRENPAIMNFRIDFKML